MIRLLDVGKFYQLDDKKVQVLKKVNINFRESEFVCILGPSGCGKTTLLNIIGGLDRYTSGDMTIDGKSTADFTDRDWDSYRNHEVGFVFQSYNLITHQSVLENVETALAISGVGKQERRKKSIKALVRVGLSEHLRKNPRQLSGGEMQRAAIARAIVNDPSVILADEPTGALDSKNSVQIMDLLKEISAKKLVVTVTHNDELAKAYATRIIRISDGEIVSDSNPYYPEEEKKEKKDEKKKSVMPYSLAMRLSFKNLTGKKIRTAMTSVASAIAILGITMVISCANGLNAFINKVQKDTLSGTPVQVSVSDTDYSSYIESIFGYIGGRNSSNTSDYPKNSVIINHILSRISSTDIRNNITPEYLDYVAKIDSSKVEYSTEYFVNKYVYKSVNKTISIMDMPKQYRFNLMVSNTSRWSQLADEEVVSEQYDVYGKFPTGANELALVVDKDSSVSDTVLASYYIDLFAGEKDENGNYLKEYYTYDEILSDSTSYGKFNLLSPDDYYHTTTLQGNNGVKVSGYKEKNISVTDYIIKYYRKGETTGREIWEQAIKNVLGEAITAVGCFDENPDEATEGFPLKIVGILKLKEDTQYGMYSSSPICFTKALTEKVISDSGKTEIVKSQMNGKSESVILSIDERGNYYKREFKGETDYKNALRLLGYADSPTKISFYPKTIADKDYLLDYLDAYNVGKAEEDKIAYTDNVGFAIELVRTVVMSIAAVLIALTSVSLIVSAIMMSIITYVSVIERTKEIGILRAVGARKKDVVRLFITETGIIGFAAGVVGVILNSIGVIPLNALFKSITGVSGFAFLSWWHVLAVIAVSVLLTIVSGLIPSFAAGKKDPVKALKTE